MNQKKVTKSFRWRTQHNLKKSWIWVKMILQLKTSTRYRNNRSWSSLKNGWECIAIRIFFWKDSWAHDSRTMSQTAMQFKIIKMMTQPPISQAMKCKNYSGFRVPSIFFYVFCSSVLEIDDGASECLRRIERLIKDTLMRLSEGKQLELNVRNRTNWSNCAFKDDMWAATRPKKIIQQFILKF